MKFLPKEIEDIINIKKNELDLSSKYNKVLEELKKEIKNREHIEYRYSRNHDVLELWCFNDYKISVGEERKDGYNLVIMNDSYDFF